MFKIGSYGKIKCALLTDDNRIYQVEWFKNEAFIKSSDKYSMNKNVLTIHEITIQDSGKYACRINVDQLNTTKSIYVNVIGIVKPKMYWLK